MSTIVLIFCINLKNIEIRAQNSTHPLIQNTYALNSFFKKLDQRNIREINIIHWGDSHVLMGYFAQTIRNGMDSLFGGTGFGMTFPYKVAGYNPFHSQTILLNGSWNGGKIMNSIEQKKCGITGFSATTKENLASIMFGLRGMEQRYPESKRITIFYATDPDTRYTMKGIRNRSDSSSIQNPMKVETKFFQNDSMPFFQTTIQFNDPVDMIRIDLMNENPVKGFTIWGAMFRNTDQLGVSYHNAGVGGSQFSHLIKSSDLHLRQAATLEPALIILSFGSNESYASNFNENEYSIELKLYIERIKSLIPNASILLTGPPDTRSRNKYPKNTTAICQILQKIATSEGCAYFDIRHKMGGDGSIYYWRKKNLASKDLLHFTPAGYAIQGNWLIEAINHAYNDYRLKNGK